MPSEVAPVVKKKMSLGEMKQQRVTTQSNNGSETARDKASSLAIPSVAVPPLALATATDDYQEDEDYSQTESARKIRKLAHFRTRCSQVEPWLFISGQLVAEDEAKLAENGITDVLNCAATVIPCAHEGLTYHKLPLGDHAMEQIDRYFYAVLDMMDTVRMAGGKLLVHCHQGVSRSCTFIVAYLMWHRGFGYNQALQTVREVRGICQPNNGFTCMLLEWQKRLEVDATPRATTWSNGTSSGFKCRVYVVYLSPDTDHLDDFCHAARLVGGMGYPEGLTHKLVAAERELSPNVALVVHTTSAIYIWQSEECEQSVIRGAAQQASYLQRFEEVTQPVRRVQSSTASGAHKFWADWAPLYSTIS